MNELTNDDNIKWLFNSKLPKLIEKKIINEVEYQKNIDRRIMRLEKERENEREEFQRKNLSLFKIYNFRKDYSRRDGETGYAPFEGTVYCPKDKVNNENQKITLDECENCNYHLKIHFKTTHLDSDVCVVCGLKSKTLRGKI